MGLPSTTRRAKSRGGPCRQQWRYACTTGKTPFRYNQITQSTPKAVNTERLNAPLSRIGTVGVMASACIWIFKSAMTLMHARSSDVVLHVHYQSSVSRSLDFISSRRRQSCRDDWRRELWGMSASCKTVVLPAAIMAVVRPDVEYCENEPFKMPLPALSAQFDASTMRADAPSRT